MKFFILNIINWLIVMTIMYLLFLLNHYDIFSFFGGIITSIILFLTFNILMIKK